MQRSFITYVCGFGFAFMLRLNAQDIERLDLRLDALVSPYATVETLATGFNWTEGPVWDNRNQRLLFSNVPMNRIHTWVDAETAVYTLPEKGAFDGLTVDALGNVYACNWKGGVFVIAPDGTHLGTIRTGHRTANCVFGGEDGKTLFITSGSRLCRIAMKVTGAHQ